MLVRGPVAVLGLLGAMALAGCMSTSSEGGESGNPTNPSPATSQPITSTTTPTTTSSSPATTATSPTTTLLEGNWADQPVVISSYGVLGWWDGQEWVGLQERLLDDGEQLTVPVKTGDEFQVALFGFEGETVTAIGSREECDFSFPTPGVIVDKPGAMDAPPGHVGVAISAPWDIFPHDVREFSDNGTYSDFARPLLAELGIDVPEPVIRQVVRFDVQGDGVDEVIAVADDHPAGGGPGDYTLAFMRELVDGSVETTVLLSEVSPFDEYGAWTMVTSVADLNGDGTMEVVMSGGAYESWGVGVWEHDGKGLGMSRVMGLGCGV